MEHIANVLTVFTSGDLHKGAAQFIGQLDARFWGYLSDVKKVPFVGHYNDGRFRVWEHLADVLVEVADVLVASEVCDGVD